MIPVAAAMALAQFAPVIIKYLTGSDKAEQAAEAVVGIAESVTGFKGDAAVEAIKADPNLAMQFRMAVMAQEADLDKAFLADRQDARRRDVELAKAGRTNTRADVMVAIDAAGLLACLIVLALYRADMPGEVVALISTIASIFGLCLRDAHQFEFGSSRGSKEKDDLVAKVGR